MLKIRDISKEEKLEYAVVAIIFLISIIIGILIGSNENWFRPAFFSAGYMAGSLLTCIGLFALYRFMNRMIGYVKKK